MAGAYDTISCHLYKVLDVIGASEDRRAQHWECAMLFETSHTLARGIELPGMISKFRFGSSCEGTTTLGLQSDLDCLACFDQFRVIDSMDDAPQYGLVYLMVSCVDTKPGYVHLQVVINRVPQTIYIRPAIPWFESVDQSGRICTSHRSLCGLHPNLTKRNGPADTSYSGTVEQDFVIALRSQTVPKHANQWISRERPCGWPSHKQIQEMASYGCFLVGVGHPKSPQRSIEWRISYSLQERDLMASLNPIQHKVYILLKMIKKDIVHPRAGVKSISSYHCKTALFHSIEQSKDIGWARRDLIHGTRICLNYLLRWARRGNCPNYFIIAENMFDRIDQITLGKVADVLEDILASGAGFLSSIKCDNVGLLLYEDMSGPNLARIRSVRNAVKIDPIAYYTSFNASFILHDRNILLNHIYRRNVHLNELQKVLALIHYLHTVPISDHRPRDVRMTLDAIIPHIHLQTAQCIAAIVIGSGGTRHSIRVTKAFLHHILDGRDCDLISARLTLATWYLRVGMMDICHEILQSCEVSLARYVTSMCRCHDHVQYKNVWLDRKVVTGNLSNKDYRRQCTTSCMVFLPSQAGLVHPALRYEMYRSVATPPGSRDDFLLDDFWMDWIVVDSRVYMYFLQYILYSHTQQPVYKQNAVDNLGHLASTDSNLGHRETAFNLLGWIHIQENKPIQALHYLYESWRVRPDHNAAKWHLAALVFSYNDE